MSDIYQTVTNQIIEALEQSGELELPWIGEAPIHRPVNAKSRNSYQGINTLTLWIKSHCQEIQSNVWATYKQWKELGCQVKKGEKSSPIIFYKEYLSRDDEEETRYVARASHVFNASQVEGYEIETQTVPKQPLFERLEKVDQFVAATNATITHQGRQAYYDPATDSITIPEINRFVPTETSTAQEGYYSTLLHELTHWTGPRLERDLEGRFGSQSYAMEELVAELGAAFLCSDLQITNRPRDDHAAYIKNWLQVLNDDRKAIFTAASLASKATAFLHQTTKPPH